MVYGTTKHYATKYVQENRFLSRSKAAIASEQDNLTFDNSLSFSAFRWANHVLSRCEKSCKLQLFHYIPLHSFITIELLLCRITLHLITNYYLRHCNGPIVSWRDMRKVIKCSYSIQLSRFDYCNDIWHTMQQFHFPLFFTFNRD